MNIVGGVTDVGKMMFQSSELSCPSPGSQPDASQRNDNLGLGFMPLSHCLLAISRFGGEGAGTTEFGTSEQIGVSVANLNGVQRYIAAHASTRECDLGKPLRVVSLNLWPRFSSFPIINRVQFSPFRL